jgi:hypothetical protein
VATGWPVDERSMLGTVLGLPGYAAIAIALGFTGLGVFIDLNRINGLGTIFKGCYFAGCVLAVCWVKRRALFGPMVQPPLLLAIAVPSVVLASGNSSTGASGSLVERALSIGGPLLNGFPTMAVATAFALAIGIARYVLQRPPPPLPRPLPGSAMDPGFDAGPPDVGYADRRPPRARNSRPEARPRPPRGDLAAPDPDGGRPPRSDRARRPDHAARPDRRERLPRSDRLGPPDPSYDRRPPPPGRPTDRDPRRSRDRRG